MDPSQNKTPGIGDNGIGNCHEEGKETRGDSLPQRQRTRDTVPPRLMAARLRLRAKSLLMKLGLDIFTLKAMFKGAMPPTIAIAIFQATPVAKLFVSVGYLAAIIGILSMPVQHRGKFAQVVSLSVLFACIGAAGSILIMWSALQARLYSGTGHTTGYNASQAAVGGLWLFAVIWLANLLRAKYPTLALPVVSFSIVVNISCTSSVWITSNATLQAIIKQILVAMLSGFAIATGTALFVFPFPSRQITHLQMRGVIMLLRGAVRQEKQYLQSLEREDMFAISADTNPHASFLSKGKSSSRDPSRAISSQVSVEAESLLQTVSSLQELVGKIQADMPFTKRDFAYDKLDGNDWKEIFRHIRSCFIPIIGISTIIDIFQRIARKRGWAIDEHTPADTVAKKMEEKRVWNEVMKQLHDPFECLADAMDQGLLHAALQLELLPIFKSKRVKPGDIEATGDLIEPGNPGFMEILGEKLKFSKEKRYRILKTWAKERGMITDDQSLLDAALPDTDIDAEQHNRDQSQLYLLLYIEKLMQEAGEAVQEFVTYADSKVTNGTMEKKRLILPKSKIIRKWCTSIIEESDALLDTSADLLDSCFGIMALGEGFAGKGRDPEHLPPANNFQRIGNGLRSISKFISSPQSAFGLRVSLATMTIAIIGFLENSYVFFRKQRLVWSMIIIAIGMTETSGQSTYGFLCRIGGSLLGMIMALVNWYIVDENTIGIIVFLFLFLFLEFYFFLKYPKYLPGVILCMVTHVLIVGYELEVRKLGVPAMESSGQPVYPIYLLAPYRVATVVGGCFVAWIWTIFPSPLSDRTYLRHELSGTLYYLANYYNVVNQLLKVHFNGVGTESLAINKAALHHLTKARRKVLGKLMQLLPSLHRHNDWQRFEATVGGAFPADLYEDVAKRAVRVTSYLSLMAYSVTPPPVLDSNGQSLVETADKPNRQELSEENATEESGEEAIMPWIETLSTLLSQVTPTQHQVISTLTILSNALQSGNSLPPHLPLPRPYELTHQLRALEASQAEKGDKAEGRASLLDAKNMAENGYAEFAVLQICGTLVCDDIAGMVETVSKLVGVVDFSFRVGADPDIPGRGKVVKNE